MLLWFPFLLFCTIVFINFVLTCYKSQTTLLLFLHYIVNDLWKNFKIRKKSHISPYIYISRALHFFVWVLIFIWYCFPSTWKNSLTFLVIGLLVINFSQFFFFFFFCLKMSLSSFLRVTISSGYRILGCRVSFSFSTLKIYFTVFWLVVLLRRSQPLLLPLFSQTQCISFSGYF